MYSKSRYRLTKNRLSNSAGWMFVNPHRVQGDPNKTELTNRSEKTSKKYSEKVNIVGHISMQTKNAFSNLNFRRPLNWRCSGLKSEVERGLHSVSDRIDMHHGSSMEWDSSNNRNQSRRYHSHPGGHSWRTGNKIAKWTDNFGFFTNLAKSILQTRTFIQIEFFCEFSDTVKPVSIKNCNNHSRVSESFTQT